MMIPAFAAAPPVDHPGQELAHGHEGRGQVRVDHRAPLLLAHLVHGRVGAEAAGEREQDVDGPELVLGRPPQALDVGGRAAVGAHADGVRARVAQLADHRVDAVAGARADDHADAVRREQLAGGGADALRAAGDDGHLSGEVGVGGDGELAGLHGYRAAARACALTGQRGASPRSARATSSAARRWSSSCASDE
jgi:hypothetical protein